MWDVGYVREWKKKGEGGRGCYVSSSQRSKKVVGIGYLISKPVEKADETLKMKHFLANLRLFNH